MNPRSLAPPRTGFRCIIIGAGMSGILSAIKLREAGLDELVLYEKADRLGGTWRENTYPGVTCDVPSHFYSYSFAPNPNWSHRFSPGAEIQAYFEDVARRYDVVSRIRYGTTITRCEFRHGRWALEAADGSTDQAAFRAHPEAIVRVRNEVSRALTDGFANHLANANSPQLQAIHDACVANLENSVKDPLLREKLRPTYRAACKRLVMSHDFYDAIQRPNARLVTEGIDRVERAGVRTRDGRLHVLDVLVLATGFRVDRFLRPMTIVGRDGTLLDDVWRAGPFAYMAISVPQFPNFFMLNGPNGPVGNFSLIEVAELQISYVLQLIERLRSGACTAVSAFPAAMRRFDAARREAARSTIWNSGCKSWYLDVSGLPTAWPWTFDRFREEMSAPRLDDFDLQ